MTSTLKITRPDDWHVHLRDAAMLAAVLPDTARQFARALVMPNLKPPVRTLADAAAYRDRILAALPEGARRRCSMRRRAACGTMAPCSPSSDT